MSKSNSEQKDIDQALHLFRSDKFQQTLDFINRLPKEFDDQALLFNIRGACYAGMGMLDNAVKNYIKSLSIKPDYSKAHYNLGSAFQELGKLNDSILSYEKSIALEYENAQAHNNLSIVQRELNQLEEAEVSCLNAIEINPNYAEAYANLSMISYSTGDKKSALKNIEIAYSINPKLQFIELLWVVLRARNNRKINDDKLKSQYSSYGKQLNSNPLILNRSVEKELVDRLYQMKSLEHYPQTDTIFGNARGSGYQLFQEDNSPIINTVRDDLVNILSKNFESDIYIKDSFFHIMSAGGAGVNRHNHIGDLDLDPSLNLIQQKFSLVYYLSTGDQDCSEPGTLKFYNPSEDIIPRRGKIVIFPADRFHSVVYNGKKDRIMISMNFYSL